MLVCALAAPVAPIGAPEAVAAEQSSWTGSIHRNEIGTDHPLTAELTITETTVTGTADTVGGPYSVAGTVSGQGIQFGAASNSGISATYIGTFSEDRLSMGGTWTASSESGNETGTWTLDRAPEPLSGSVADGQGGFLPGVEVELRDNFGETVAGPVTTDFSGSYTIPPVEPAEYFLRATLVDAATDPPLLKTHFKEGGQPVHIQRFVTPNDFGSSDFDLEFSQGPELHSTNATGFEDLLDDMAVAHRRSDRFLDELRESLNVTPAELGPVTVRMFTNSGCSSGAAACYRSSTDEVFLAPGRSVALDPDEFDENKEVLWHELAHHLEFSLGIATELGCKTGDDENHGGWSNHSSCDSVLEGFATYLPTYVSQILDAAPDDRFSSFPSLDIHGWQAWTIDGTIEREDFAVAAVLWDLADATDDGRLATVRPADPNDPPVQFGYLDVVEIGFVTLSNIIRQTTPQTVDELRDLLIASADVAPGHKELSIDLDGDAVNDVSELDLVFLEHGFHPVELGDATFSYRIGTPIGRSDHEPDPANPPDGLLERHTSEHRPGSEVLLRNDSSQSRTVTITASDGTTNSIWTRTLAPGEEFIQELDLPPHVIRRIEPGDPLPPCGPDNDALLQITISAPGVDPLSTDSCQFAHAVAASNGAPALTYAVTPPDMTIKGPKNATALGDGVYTTDGSGQTSATKVKRGKTAIFQITAQNDTIVPDTLTVTGCQSSRGFRVSFFDDGTNVTAQVIGGGLSTEALDAGEFDALELRIKVGRRGPKSKSCLVTASSENSPSLQDAVLGKVKVKS